MFFIGHSNGTFGTGFETFGTFNGWTFITPGNSRKGQSNRKERGTAAQESLMGLFTDNLKERLLRF